MLSSICSGPFTGCSATSWVARLVLSTVDAAKQERERQFSGPHGQMLAKTIPAASVVRLTAEMISVTLSVESGLTFQSARTAGATQK